MCGIIGALSLCRWLRDYVLEVIGGTKDFLLKSIAAMIQEKKINMIVKVSSEDTETQTQATYMG